MSGPIVVGWECNLAAELELIDPDFVPSRGLQARVAAQAARFLELSNVYGGGVVCHVDASEPADVVLDWMPTRGARRDVLVRVNHRRFAFELGGGLADARFCTTQDEVERALSARPFPSLGYLLKRPFGFSGRARKHLDVPAFEPSDARWIEASMTKEYGGGVLVEPVVSIEAEFSLHGFVRAAGEPLFGVPVRQVVDADGGWVDAGVAEDGELARDEAEALRTNGCAAAEALRGAGYRGPFSIDAYRYDEGFCALGELNARYSMAYFVGVSRCVGEWLASARFRTP